MTAEKPSDPNEYPLTVVATDVHGEECYRTQIDWTGVARSLEDVPSDDLDRRRPRWANVKVFTATGREIESKSNDRAGDKDDDENVVVKDEGTAKADARTASEVPSADSKNPDKGTLKADDQAADKADYKAKAEDKPKDEKAASKK